MKSFCKDIVHVFLTYVFNLFPVKYNKVVFNNFYGRGFGDNPKYIAKELLRSKVRYDLVWLLKNMDDDLPIGIRKVRYNRVRCAYEIATARVIVSNVKGDLFFKKKKCQYYIQTWHGSFGLKYIEGEAIKTLSKRYIRKSKFDSKQTDVFISNSHLQSVEYRRALWCDSAILESGSPRNDLLFSDVDKEQIKATLRISSGKKIVLYAPTFRDDKSIDCFDICPQRVLKSLKELTGDDWIMIVKMHPGLANAPSLFCNQEEVLDVTNHLDTQELLLISDILISDYSSVMLDYVLLRRPIFIYASDLSKYRAMRGLKPVFFDLPFSISQTVEELISNILMFKENDYQGKLSTFFNYYSPFDKGDASKQVMQLIENYIN